MADALAKVKAQLGRDAVILHTRTMKRGGVLGIGARSWVEITATADPRLPAIRAAAESAESGRRADQDRAHKEAEDRSRARKEAEDQSRAREEAEDWNQSRDRKGAVGASDRVPQPESQPAPSAVCSADQPPPTLAPHPFTLIDWVAPPPDREPARPESRDSMEASPATPLNDPAPVPDANAASTAGAVDVPCDEPATVASAPRGRRETREDLPCAREFPTAVVERDAHSPGVVGRGGPALPAQHPDAGPAIRVEVAEIRTMVRDLLRQAEHSRRAAVPAELVDYYTQLVGQDVAQQLAAEIVESIAGRLQQHGAAYWDQHGRLVSGAVPTPDWIRGELERHIAELLPPAAPLQLAVQGRPTVVALVGPTGVGKTTTVAKLAANMKLREGRRVGLITIDTYRIAAVEQLKTYAEILQVPLVAVTTPEEMAPAVRQMADAELILIDTAGRSQKDELRIADLRRFLAAIEPDQVHLVLSSTSREEAIREAIRNFSVLGVKHVIFTKLDEAVGFGVLLNVLRSVDLRLSYLTTGQSVPADIEPGCAQRVAQLLLNGRLDALSACSERPASEPTQLAGGDSSVPTRLASEYSCVPARRASEGEGSSGATSWSPSLALRAGTQSGFAARATEATSVVTTCREGN